MTFSASISNEELSNLALANFEGRIIVVESEESMREAEKALRGAKVIGFDTETRPSFSKGVHYTVSLLQLSTETTAILFRLKKVILSPTIIAILCDEGVLKIGAAIRDDLRILRAYQEFTPAGFIDLQSIVSKWGIKELSVRKMAAIVLSRRISKAQRLSNWEATRLTPSQMDYAAMDAWVCREIYLTLKASPTVEAQ